MPLSPLDLLEILASGQDFRNGQRLPADHLINHPDVIRTLHWTVRTLSSSADTKLDAAVLPLHKGKIWSREEEQLLREAFEKAVPLAAMAKSHGRSRGSIVARLQKLSLMQ